MGLMSRQDVARLRVNAWHTQVNNLPKEHRAYYIFVDGVLRYPRLNMTKANTYMKGLNLAHGQVARLEDAKGKVLARKNEHGIEVYE